MKRALLGKKSPFRRRPSYRKYVYLALENDQRSSCRFSAGIYSGKQWEALQSGWESGIAAAGGADAWCIRQTNNTRATSVICQSRGRIKDGKWNIGGGLIGEGGGDC